MYLNFKIFFWLYQVVSPALTLSESAGTGVDMVIIRELVGGVVSWAHRQQPSDEFYGMIRRIIIGTTMVQYQVKIVRVLVMVMVMVNKSNIVITIAVNMRIIMIIQ